MALCRLANMTLSPNVFIGRIIQPSSVVQTARQLSTDVFDENVDEESQRLEELRDISGLTERQKRRLRGQMPDIDVNNEYQNSVRYHRKLYAKLGSKSGVDPRLSWTGRKKALELAALLREWEPPLQDRLDKLEAQKQEAASKQLKREQKVAENMAKMDQWITEYRQRQSQKDAEALKKEEKKRKILEEAREYFGYYVDPRDSKFKEMMEEKEKQEKELAKKQKKEKRLEKLAARLQHMAQEEK
ncbi:large ribosomal subunit protein mL64-like [Babylonia areolata]|uniref:large ribosomal subunit protein mL64-like n=1 Tax=Babylonia areolata TaxID=304850 RepID=UPI003FD23424